MLQIESIFEDQTLVILDGCVWRARFPFMIIHRLDERYTAALQLTGCIRAGGGL